MKKLLATLFTLLTLIPLHTLNAQNEVVEGVDETIEYAKENITFGFKAGLNFASLTGENDQLNPDRLTGLNIGLYGRYPFSDRVSAKAEVMYSMQGARSDEFAAYEDFAINLNYIQIPILAEILFADVVRLEVGPYVAFEVVSRQSFKDFDVDQGERVLFDADNNTVDFGFAVGATYEFSQRFAMGARYSRGLVDALGSDFLGEGNNDVVGISGYYRFE